MEPVPETVEALEELEPGTDGRGLREVLVRLADRARQVVPDLVGVSIGWVEERLTLTLVATADEIAVLDAVQYAAGGPCVAGAGTGEVHEHDEGDPLDEERWRLFAEATAARAVRSTLSLPLVRDGRVAGTVNLYAGSRCAFAGHHDALAAIFGGWALGAVTNADLSFATRSEAAAAPRRVREQRLVDTAVGILAERLAVDPATAERRLHEAAVRAGVPVGRLAADIVGADEHDEG